MTVFDQEGACVRQFGSNGSANGQFSGPRRIAMAISMLLTTVTREFISFKLTVAFNWYCLLINSVVSLLVCCVID